MTKVRGSGFFVCDEFPRSRVYDEKNMFVGASRDCCKYGRIRSVTGTGPYIVERWLS